MSAFLITVSGVATFYGSAFLGHKALSDFLETLNGHSKRWSDFWADVFILFLCGCGMATALHSTITAWL